MIQPSIALARQGIPVTFSLERAMIKHRENIFQDPGLKNVFFDIARNDTLRKGQFFKRVQLADTLERIARNGYREFYEGKTGRKFIKDLQRHGGILTMQDLKDYE